MAGGAPSEKKGRELDKGVVEETLRRGITFEMHINKTTNKKSIKRRHWVVLFHSFLDCGCGMTRSCL